MMARTTSWPEQRDNIHRVIDWATAFTIEREEYALAGQLLGRAETH